MQKVTMYSISTCPWSTKAKKYFEERQIPYEYTDYDRADDARQQAIAKDMHHMENAGFPMVKIGRHVVVGYKPDVYNDLLRKKA